MAFPGLTGEPTQKEHMDPEIVKEDKRGQAWWPLIIGVWQPHCIPSRNAGNRIKKKKT